MIFSDFVNAPPSESGGMRPPVFAQRNAAPDFARQTQKAGPVTGQPGFAAGEMRLNGSKGRGGNGSRAWEKRKASAFAGPITKSADGVTFLVLRK